VICEKHSLKLILPGQSINFVGCVKCMEDANFLFSDYSDLTSEMVFEDLEKLIQNFDSNG
jgi:hypothetical protein